VQHPPIDGLVVTVEVEKHSTYGPGLREAITIGSIIVVVAAARHGRAFMGMSCVQHPPIDDIVVAAAARHGRDFLGTSHVQYPLTDFHLTDKAHSRFFLGRG